MSGEDEKGVVAPSEAEAGRVDTKPGEAVEESDKESKEEDSDTDKKEEKKSVQRKVTPSKAKEENVEDTEQADEDSDVEEKTPKKKKASPRKPPAKKSKKNESSDEEDEEKVEKPTSPKRSPRKRPPPKKAKVEKNEDLNGGGGVDKDEEEDVEEEKEEKPVKKGVPLLDQPLEVVGSRERKRVSRFEEEFNKEKDEKKGFEVPVGKGIKLGDIARVEYNIARFKADDLKPVSRALFGGRGPTKMVLRKCLRSFNGFDFEENSEQFEKRKVALQKMGLKQLKLVADFLDVEKVGTLPVILDRVLNYCLEPKDSGKKVVLKSKRKSAVASRKKNYAESDDSESKPSRSKRGKGKQTTLKEVSSSSETEVIDKKKSNSKKGKKVPSIAEESSEDEKNKEDDESNDVEKKEEKNNDADKNDSKSEEEEEAKEEEPEEEEPEEKPKRGRKAPAKKTKTTKSVPVKKAPSKKKQVSESEHEEDPAESSDDDHPLVKKAKPSLPSDEEIKSYVKKILEGANLEEITMKTVCKQVYEHYPDHDLAHKKELIKDTVKSLIAT